MQFSFSDLPRPFYALAPMEDVTDRVFRSLIADLAKPHIFYTEFISALALQAKRRTTMAALSFAKNEQPIIAQIWGTDPESFFDAAVLLTEYGYNGIDINMGCPAKKIIRKGACAGLIGNKSLSSELIHAVREGIRSTGSSIPISVKTRSGITTDMHQDWCRHLLEQNLDAICLHPRTAEQQSDGVADWTQIRNLAEQRTAMQLSTAVIGNGDVRDLSTAAELSACTGADGIMIGRGIFHNPYIFNPSAAPLAVRSREEKINLAIEHTQRFRRAYGSSRNFEILKKFFKCYLQSYPGSETELSRLMKVHSYEEATEMLEGLLSTIEETTDSERS
ncbi:tRNA dihydrouridine synthase [Spirochaeta dissipatitropha]